MSNPVAEEQRYLTMLYARLDDVRASADGRLRTVLREQPLDGQERSQRDAVSTMYLDRIAQLDAAEHGLCFGRLDLAGDGSRHIGRIGLRAGTPDRATLLVDWRADGARPFYLATVAAPDGVRRRRLIQTRLREVTGVDDEALDATALDADSTDGGIVNENALLVALTAERTGRMRDIVSTIQSEQDQIIRADRSGVLVVEGGPGTGKTAVALHRAAYLLYHHREQLASRAVLIVGPNGTFLRYIGRVLPGLGETAVVLTTLGDLLPDVRARAVESDDTAAVKGHAGMADVLAAAVADRQRIPGEGEPWEVLFDRDTLWLHADVCATARDAARHTRLPHNEARPVFVSTMIEALAHQAADRVGADAFGGPNLLTAGDLAQIRDDLRSSAAVTAALDELWPQLTPADLLADLWADPDLLEIAAPDMTAADRALLRRDRDHGWTVADVPLLDEAADLLGEDGGETAAQARAEAARDRAYAEGVLDILSRDIDDDDEVLMAHDLIDSTRLAGRHVAGDTRTVAERAAADRQWAYGHVIVDEAQELSPMAWRALMRRCPSRSMTLVGDVAQTSDPAGATGWGEALAPHVADRWRLRRLGVNYRTPAEIMAVAEAVLHGIDPALRAPTSIRSTGVPPWRRRVTTEALAGALRDTVAAERVAVGDGRIAVIVPEPLYGTVCTALPDAAAGDDADLTSPVVVLSVRQAKGLEFDAVVVVEPALIEAGTARGANDLYVALTRATARLGIVHTGALPDALAGIPAR